MDVLPRLRSLAPAAALVFASYAFRVPPLLNARATNSDAAVVGLQAMHMLHAPRAWSPFLWGSGYQTSADATFAAIAFAIFGATPLVLMLSALTLHVVATLFVFGAVRRRFSPWASVLLTLPLVVSPSSVHSYALYPPRQASLTIALAALFVLDAASFAEGAARERRLFGGGLLATLAIAADPYPLVLLPVAAALALFAGSSKRGATRALSGAVVGAIPFYVLHQLAGEKSGPMGLTTSMIGHHARLLWDECLPWALSYKVYYAHHVMDWAPWDAPPAFTALGVLGAIVLFAMVAVGLVAPLPRLLARLRVPPVPPPVARIGFAGALGFVAALAGFLVSVMVMDHFSMRYLAVLTLLTPFAVAPAAHLLGTKRFAIAFAPHLVASAIGGWVGYGNFVRGPLPVVSPETASDGALLDVMRARGLRYATADYWASYRLTFVLDEAIVVVPKNASEDRYRPYRKAFEASPIYAYVYDPQRSREDVAEAERALRAESESVERVRAGDLTVFVVKRVPAAE